MKRKLKAEGPGCKIKGQDNEWLGWTIQGPGKTFNMSMTKAITHMQPNYEVPRRNLFLPVAIGRWKDVRLSDASCPSSVSTRDAERGCSCRREGHTPGQLKVTEAQSPLVAQMEIKYNQCSTLQPLLLSRQTQTQGFIRNNSQTGNFPPQQIHLPVPERKKIVTKTNTRIWA